MQKNMCISENTLKKAISTKDISICNTITDPMGKSMCTTEVVKAKIESSNNVKDCDILDEMQKRQCIYTATL
jgi:hypothetical protein